MTQRIFLSWCRVRLGVVVLLGAASLAVPVDAANPHLVSADPTMSDPVFVPPSLAWDGSLTVPFRIAGLGNNEGLDVTLHALLTFDAFVKGTTTLNSLTAHFGFTSPSGVSLTLIAASGPPSGSASLTFDSNLTHPALTSDKNGNVSGTLAIPGTVSASIPDNLACVRVSWTKITLTFNGQTVDLPDVSHLFSTGSSCPF